MADELERRVSRLEEEVSSITQVRDDAFSEDSVSEASDSDSEADNNEEDKISKCPEVKSDGEVCGRERPCPYHDEE